MKKLSDEQTQSNNNLVVRPPIVVVMGHIDHGKTTLLDYIRKTDVTTGESGGITQHIGAYQIEIGSNKITFIDTPGHEAFSKMRSRGAKIADIAILVVAGDDGVKPQTKESILTIKEAKIPFVVAINKIDKESADLERVKNELAGEEVFLEGRGGNVPFVEISAKTGQGVSQLLETVILLSELEDLSADLGKNARGVIVESHLDSKRGITATLLILEGTLKKNQFIFTNETVSKVRIFEDFNGNSIDSAGPSSPVLVVGFASIPKVGLEFQSFVSQEKAIEFASNSVENKNNKKVDTQKFNGLPEICLVIKSDTAGSIEAILSEIEKLKRDYFNLKILRADVGDVSDDDIKLSGSSKNSLVVAFRVKFSSFVRDFSQKIGIEIRNFDVIYDIYEFLKNKIEEMLPSEIVKTILGKAKVLKIFPFSGKGLVVGGKVVGGSLEKGSKFIILRRAGKIGEGRVENLQTAKINIEKVEAGKEFGAKIVCSIDVMPGDELEIFKEEEIKRKI